MKVEIVFPIYNEALNIKYLIDSIDAYLKECKKLNKYEFIFTFVNDGSKDESLKYLICEAKRLIKYKIIDLSRNFGHQNALSAAFSISESDAIIVMDADLQDPLYLIELLLEKFNNDVEIVHAVRLKRDGETYFKKMTANLFYSIFSKLTSFPVTIDSGDCKLYSKRVINDFNQIRKHDLFFRGLSNYLGYKSESVFYKREPRKFGSTKYPFSKMLEFASRAILNFSEKPLIYFGNFYIIISSLLFLLLVSISIFEKVTNGAVKGWTSLIMVITTFNLLNSVFLYLIGIYIAKITKNIIDYPNFIINKIIE
jgi:dolichol-phosphate mannosyltransferase